MRVTSGRAVRERWRALRRADDGAAVVELAIFIPLLLVMLMGAVDFGRIVVTSIAVSDAVRAGAQYGAQNNATFRDSARIDSATRAAFNQSRYGTLTITSLQRQCRCPGSWNTVACTTLNVCGAYGAPRAYVTVSASRAVSLFVRYPGVAASFTPARTATMRQQ